MKQPKSAIQRLRDAEFAECPKIEHKGVEMRVRKLTTIDLHGIISTVKAAMTGFVAEFPEAFKQQPVDPSITKQYASVVGTEETGEINANTTALLESLGLQSPKNRFEQEIGIRSLLMLDSFMRASMLLDESGERIAVGVADLNELADIIAGDEELREKISEAAKNASGATIGTEQGDIHAPDRSSRSEQQLHFVRGSWFCGKDAQHE